jgi:hypothetical protein
MKVIHEPLKAFNQDKVIEMYSEKDGTPVKYVCTTEILPTSVVADVYYRDTPHPEFGNRYFGVFVDGMGRGTITSMDAVEDYDFVAVLDDDGNYQYSQHRHDFKKFENGAMIDGGRHYIRSSGSVDMFQVKDGEFIKFRTDKNISNTLEELK